MSISEQTIDILNTLCEKFGIVIDWTQENVLPYIENLCTKFISWKIWVSVYWIVFMGLLLVILFFISKKITKKYTEVSTNSDCSFERDFGWQVAMWSSWVAFGAVALSYIFVFGVCLHDITTCLTFPETIIFNELQSVISG